MRMSCNGCRVLRKGCSENCSIRPCLQWIKSPESQANATVFLAKFYGRAGLLNLVNAGPEHLRPAIFRSLLYEACGRIVNPIYGSVGLLWSGSWQLCQNAVEAVLQGTPIIPIASDTAETNNGPPLKAYDIRHITKDENSGEVHWVRTRGRFKRSGGKGKASRVWIGSREEESGQDMSSHESALSHQSEVAHGVEGESREVETSPGKKPAESDQAEVELELTLGHELVYHKAKGKEVIVAEAGAEDEADDSDDDGDDLNLRLDYPAA
ncbi:LOB domain-containing protein 41-like [Bidens hawaiensis]|uniref:LOB domain-containing protein 41-like n=1 Tax=Bidens hawaiensis TaxID=980011 RepID=UPI0040492268